MSLFGNPSYRYRETYFILFEPDKRPSEQELIAAIEELGDRYEIKEVHRDGEDEMESMTIVSPSDFAGIDLTYVEGEEVAELVSELNDQFKTITLTGDELRKISHLGDCRSRFDLLHFEEVTHGEEEFLDPGSLLTVIEKIASLCDGVGIDRESLTII